MAMTLTSASFTSGGEIPRRHSCQGDDRSPPLSWSGVPDDARSLVLIVDDPDAPDPSSPRMTYVHWVVYNLPVASKGLEEGVAVLPPESGVGLNDWGRAAYGGPCPPLGRHRYFFKLYALNTMLPDLGQTSKATVEKAMRGHVVAEAQLVGTYQKARAG
jgi:Raf kinase inhibitor-like YbhB/YbcL family protein